MPMVVNDFAMGQNLPDRLPVYTLNSQTTNIPHYAAKKAILPIDNSYHLNPGCYIACYTKGDGIYKVDYHISVVGQIRIKGMYRHHICRPWQNETLDISKSSEYSAYCAYSFPESCSNNRCWAGGETFVWFENKDYKEIKI